MKSKPKEPKEPKVKAPAGKASTLPEPMKMARMTPMAPPKKLTRDHGPDGEESSESEDDAPKVAEVRRDGPSGKVVRVVLTSRKGSKKKIPARSTKKIKSREVIPTTDDSAQSGTENEGAQDKPPLKKAQSRAKSRAKSDAGPVSEPGRKKAKVREIPPLPDHCIQVSTKCNPCEKRGEACYFETSPSGYVVAKVCHVCVARKVRCWFQNPEDAPQGMNDPSGEQTGTIHGLAFSDAPGPIRQLPAPPNAPFSFLEADLGEHVERLRVVKAEDLPAPGVAGEEDATPLTTVGDLFVHLVELVRQLKEENAELRRDLQGLGTQVLVLDARQVQSHRETLAAIRMLGREGDENSLANYIITTSANVVVGPSGSNRPSTTPAPGRPQAMSVGAPPQKQDEAASKELTTAEEPTPAEEPKLINEPKPAEETMATEEPKPTEPLPPAQALHPVEAADRTEDQQAADAPKATEEVSRAADAPKATEEASLAADLTEVQPTPSPSDVAEHGKPPEPLPNLVDPSLVMDDADNGSHQGADDDAQGDEDEEAQRSRIPPANLADDVDMQPFAPSPMQSSADEDGVSEPEEQEPPKKPKRGRGKKAQEPTAAEAIGPEPGPPKKRRKVESKQEVDPAEADESPKKRGRPPVAGKGKAGAATTRRGATGGK